ncbi:MAG: nitroreductase family protein [Clostridiales bacterium]|nr:nitroreductase family protein [Clostridiales bacterium]
MINSLDYQTLQRTAERRRSLYDLSADLPITTEELHGLLRDILRTTPSGFNSQTARLVLLSGAEHRQAWDVIQRCVQPLTEPAAFEKTVAKMDGFRRAAGTILFFEDGEILRDLEQRFPKFANNVPLFSAHTSAMHQYAAWTQLAALNIGANLQHYNPVADDALKAAFNLPQAWELHAQMVFGGILSPTGKPREQKRPVEERLVVLGEK